MGLNNISTVSKGTKYEKFIEKICYSINSYNCFKLFELKQHKKMTGISGIEHSIDVFWDFEFQQKRYKCILECKDYEKAISKEKVATLESISRDFKNVIPIIVSTKGFQSGAQGYAKAKNVIPLICRTLNENDWKDRIKSIDIHLVFIGSPHFNLKITKDNDWCKQNNYDNFKIDNLEKCTIINKDNFSEITIKEYCKNWLNLNMEDRNEEISFNEAYIKYEPNNIFFKISKLNIEVKFDKTEETISVDGEESIQAMVEDVLNDTRAIIDKRGAIKIIDK